MYTLRRSFRCSQGLQRFLPSVRSIFKKNTDLDHTKYKPNLYEYKDQYMKTYKVDDPKKISKEEITKMQNELPNLEELENEKAEKQSPKSLEDDEINPEIYNEFSSKIEKKPPKPSESAKPPPSDSEPTHSPPPLPEERKEINEKLIIEILHMHNAAAKETESTQLHEYEEYLMNLERHNKQKKKSTIIFRNLNPSFKAPTNSKDSPSPQKITNSKNGEDLTYADFGLHYSGNTHFPVENWFDFNVECGGVMKKTLKLQSYKYEAEGGETKGLVYFFHGYGTYVGLDYYGYAQALAYEGFTCMGFDHRGFGRSEGQRG